MSQLDKIFEGLTREQKNMAMLANKHQIIPDSFITALPGLHICEDHEGLAIFDEIAHLSKCTHIKSHLKLNKGQPMINDKDRAESMGETTREKLRQFIARIERLEAEKAELAVDIREVYAESKTFGFDVKILRKTIALRKIEAGERSEQEALIDLYMDAVEG